MNLVCGDRVTVTESVFSGGSYWGGFFKGGDKLGGRTWTGVIEKESHGSQTGEHKLCLRVLESSGTEAPRAGKRIWRSARNIYANLTAVEFGPDADERLRAGNNRSGHFDLGDWKQEKAAIYDKKEGHLRKPLGLKRSGPRTEED